MIVNKETKTFITRADKPNINWTKDNNYIVLDDNSEIARRIIENYPNVNILIEGDEIVDVELVTPSPINYTHDEINQLIVSKIREKYSVNDEFKMVNLGLSNPDSEDYKTYRAYVEECIEWGDSLNVGGED